MKTTLKKFGLAVLEKVCDILPGLIIFAIIAAIFGGAYGLFAICDHAAKKEADKFYASAENIAYSTEIKDVTYDTMYKSNNVSFYVWFENSLGEEIHIEIPEEEYKEYIKAIGTEMEVIAVVGEKDGKKIEKDHILDINFDPNNLVTMNKLEK